MTRTLIVDDEADMRLLVRLYIERADEGLEVVAEAATGGEAMRLWRQTAPDVVVVDQRMPGMTGMEVAEAMLAEQPGQAVIIFTAFADEDAPRLATAHGVRAVVDKRQLAALPDVIRELSPPSSPGR